MGAKPIVLVPNLPTSANTITERLYRHLSEANPTGSQTHRLIRDLLASPELEALDDDDARRTRLFLQVLGDLNRQGWTFRYAQGSLTAHPPSLSNGNGADQQEVKRHLRRSLEAARNEQLLEPAVRRFIRRMERPRWRLGRQVSVQNLFITGESLAADLRRRMSAPPAVRESLLAGAVKPYLQMVTEDRDEFTGLKLTDIWRYCRYTWSLPLNAQPGRQMMYLVRDAARDFHPIMGIGALGSSVVQITSRDGAIGWSLEAFKESVVRIAILKQERKELFLRQEDATRTEREAKHTARQITRLTREIAQGETRLAEHFRALERAIDSSLSDIYSKDLASPEEIAHPTIEVLERLQAVADGVAALNTLERSTKSDDLVQDALTPLYRKKRAVELHRLLRAKREFQAARTDDGADELHRLDSLLSSKNGQQAIRTALRSVKKRHIGSSIMDITTCGAIPPYGNLLGGKLVSLLMASPQVIADYRHRYHNTPSEIASRMKGEQVVRPPSLVLLGTTSLYHVGSSQYSRIRAPVANGTLEYRRVGKTKGFGSVHISKRTYRTLQELLRTHPELEAESSAFAAGVNYKLRSIASALQYLGLGKLQQHESPRIVYLVPLAKNWREYLLGIHSQPEYIYADINDPAAETQELIEFWKRRWFLPRAQRAEVLDRLAADRHTIRVTSALRVGPLLEAAEEPSGDAPVKAHTGTGSMSTDATLSWRTLASLKDQRASFAERLTDAELRALHISTKLDESLVERVRAGRRIYLTGNPGDGKTHIIQRYRAELEDAGAFLHLDASAEDEATLLQGLGAAIQKGQPAVVAINEGPLRRLLSQIPEPDRSEIEAQLNAPFVYRNGTVRKHSALVVNLGLRQVLSSSILESALDLVLGGIDYTGAPDGIRLNHKMLSRPRVRERLQLLLGYVARGGAHVTMHELFGFLSFIITAGKEDTDSGQVPPYYQLVFDRENPLVRWLGPLDPASIPHPLLDMVLWDGTYENVEWLETPDTPAPVDHADKGQAIDSFNALKRRYFFEARGGNELFSMIPEDQKTFHDLVRESTSARETAKVRLLDSLSHFFGEVSSGLQDNQIRIWSGLRYEVIGPPTAFVSSQAVPAERVHIAVPRLRPEIDGLLEYEPTHIQLLVEPVTEGGQPISLDVDYELWLALMQIKRGMPQRYHDPVIGRRLTHFMSRLAAEYESSDAGYVEMYVRDVENEKNFHVKVSLETGRYLWD